MTEAAPAPGPGLAPGLGLGELGSVLSEPVRLRMLDELLSGTPLPAGALAARVGVAPSTASSHLRRLHDAGLVEVVTQGRSRLYSVTRADVAEAVEALLRLTVPTPGSGLRAVRRVSALRQARSCYDHLAGVVGVTLYDVALARGWVEETAGGTLHLPPGGLARCADDLGLDVVLLPGTREPVRACPDWTERRPHLAGRLGSALLLSMTGADWLRRRPHDRALAVTATGRVALSQLHHDLATELGDGAPARFVVAAAE